MEYINNFNQYMLTIGFCSSLLIIKQPYMYILIKLYGSLAPFCQQGLEKLNDNITKDYFRSTNQRDGESLSQLTLSQPCRV